MASDPVLVRADSDLNWQHDWDTWLPDGVTISTRQWSISPTGPTLTNDTGEAVNVSGFESNKVYHLKEAVTLDNGEVDSRIIVLRCQ